MPQGETQLSNQHKFFTQLSGEAPRWPKRGWHASPRKALPSTWLHQGSTSLNESCSVKGVEGEERERGRGAEKKEERTRKTGDSKRYCTTT